MGAVTYLADPHALRQRAASAAAGRSGLDLPAVSLGLWHNFGDDRPLETQRAILRRAFDLGVTHFDLANNYGPPYGSAESNFGAIFAQGLPARTATSWSSPRRPGYDMWPGPYGECGVAQVPAREPRPVAGAHGRRLRRHLLQPPLRPGHAARGDDGRAGHGRPLRAGAVRRHLLLLAASAPARPPRSCASWARRC